jgi:hypothetical protein
VVSQTDKGRRRVSLSPSSPSSPGADCSLGPLYHSVSGGGPQKAGTEDRGPPVYARPPGAQSPTGPLGRGPPPLLMSPTAHRPPPTAIYVTHRPRNLHPTLHFVPNAPKIFAAARHRRGGRGREGRKEEKGKGEGEGEEGKGEGGRREREGAPGGPAYVTHRPPLMSPTAHRLRHPPPTAYVTHRPPLMSPTAAYVTHRCLCHPPPNANFSAFLGFSDDLARGPPGAPARP